MSELGYEFVLVEQPLMVHLESMGWRNARGSAPDAAVPTDPKRSFRTSFTEALLESVLRQKLWQLNLDANGDEWLDEHRIRQAVGELTRLGATSLLDERFQGLSVVVGHQ